MKNISMFLIVIVLLGSTVLIKNRAQRFRYIKPDLHFVSIAKDIDSWHGVDLEIEKDVREMLNPDKLFYRRYYKAGAATDSFIDLYGVFYYFQGAGRTMHSPMNCYPGGGWFIKRSEDVIITGDDKSHRIKAKKLSIRKGLLNSILYYWYYAGGTTASGQYENKLATLYSALFNGRNDGGLVVISAPVDRNGKNEDTMEKDFIPKLIDRLSNQPIAQR